MSTSIFDKWLILKMSVLIGRLISLDERVYLVYNALNHYLIAHRLGKRSQEIILDSKMSG